MEDFTQETGQTFLVPIEQELKHSYLRYAMSVIVSRALPDVRDGIKPVHRRILYAMHEMGLRAHLSFKKCGRVVGDVLGKFHPHGEQSIYDALTRLAQHFSLRYPLVQGQGNFGSIDGDPPAAMRYTESRLSQIAELFLADIEKETVDFTANYDESLQEPSVLPSAFPQLLANGSSGIAVGMTTNIPAHNLRELSNAICAMIENPTLDCESLLQYVKGPDFPTGGIICGIKGIHQAYRTGQGHITLRARIDLEEKGGKQSFVITEIPYQVKKSDLLRQIAQQVQNKTIEGITDIRDESDKKGTRAILFLKKAANTDVVLNQLYKNSDLQTTFGFHALALVEGYPRTLTLPEMIQAFIDHRRVIITRRTTFELKKAREREHILIGYVRALEAIDEVIRIVRASLGMSDARSTLIARFDFSEKQAQAILDMRLYRLSSMEVQQVKAQLAELRARILDLESILADRKKVDDIVIEETRAIEKKFADERRTEIVADEVEYFELEDLLQEQTVVITVSGGGYAKRVPLNKYRTQSRGGKGSSSSRRLLDSDYIAQLATGSSHSYVIFLTSKGRAFWLKAYNIPEGSRDAKGHHISTLLPFQRDEALASVLIIPSFDEHSFIFFATARGKVKKLSTMTLRHAKRRGTTAITLLEGDRLVDAFMVSDAKDFFLVSHSGKGLRFSAAALRTMGRQAQGVCGMKLKEGDMMVAACAVHDDDEIFLITERGYGKRMRVKEFSPHGRGTGGQIAYKIDLHKTGKLFDVIGISKEDTCVAIAESGKTVRFSVDKVSLQKRNTMGVCVIDVSPDDRLRAVSRADA